MHEISPDVERQIARLRAESADWANMATLARLELDSVRSELTGLKREKNVLVGENRKLRSVVLAAEQFLAVPDVSDGVDAIPAGVRLKDALQSLKSRSGGRLLPVGQAWRVGGA